MKKLHLFTFILLVSTQLAIAQQSIAKMKFEEAEEAYSANDFETTITKLNEVETILKSTNPKVMYLKIMAQSKLVEKSPLKNFKILENLRKTSFKYLEDYQNTLNNEDKYREIYSIVESLKKYPKSESGFIPYSESLKIMGDNSYYGKGMVVNYANALKYYIDAIEAGNKKSYVELGDIYLNGGNGVEKNEKKALECYSKALEKKDKYAQNQLGLMYALGLGVQLDYNLSAQYFQQSAEQGYSIAVYNLGLMYHMGIGFKEDHDLAKKNYLLAADMGDSRAKYAVGFMYYRGDFDTKADYNKAFEYINSAADQGLNCANSLLGHMYYHGNGVKKDKSRALSYGYSETFNKIHTSFKENRLKDLDLKHLDYNYSTTNQKIGNFPNLKWPLGFQY